MIALLWPASAKTKLDQLLQNQKPPVFDCKLRGENGNEPEFDQNHLQLPLGCISSECTALCFGCTVEPLSAAAEVSVVTQTADTGFVQLLSALFLILCRTLPPYAAKCPVLSCPAPMPLCLMGSAAPDAGVSTEHLLLPWHLAGHMLF